MRKTLKRMKAATPKKKSTLKSTLGAMKGASKSKAKPSSLTGTLSTMKKATKPSLYGTLAAMKKATPKPRRKLTKPKPKAPRARVGSVNRPAKKTVAQIIAARKKPKRGRK